MLIEIVLWLCFIFPGLLYSLWRLTTRKQVCRECESPDVVPVTSPLGRKLMAETEQQLEVRNRAGEAGRSLGKLARSVAAR
jgi:hypothetical protein